MDEYEFDGLYNDMGYDAEEAAPENWENWPEELQYDPYWEDLLARVYSMVKENSVAFVDISENTIVQGNLPENVHMSLFINEKRYLCLSNLGDKPAKVELRKCWSDRQTDAAVNAVQLQPGSICFLENTEANIRVN